MARGPVVLGLVEKPARQFLNKGKTTGAARRVLAPMWVMPCYPARLDGRSEPLITQTREEWRAPSEK